MYIGGVRFWWWWCVWWGDNRCPPSTGDGSTGLIASSLAPALSSPSLSSAPLLSTFFLFEKNCEKSGSSFARLGHLLPLFALPLFAHEKPATARVGAVLK